MTQLRLFGILGLALMMMAIVGTITRMAHTIEAQRAATGAAIGDPGLARRRVIASIEALGRDHRDLIALRAQLAGEAALAAGKRAELAKASKIAQERSGGFEATSARLDASARAAPPVPPRCEASDTLKGQWK